MLTVCFLFIFCLLQVLLRLRVPAFLNVISDTGSYSIKAIRFRNLADFRTGLLNSD